MRLRAHAMQVKPVNVFSSPESSEATADWSNIEPQVTQIAFSMDGETMVTLDVRADASTTRSYTTSLKFWDRRVRGIPAPNAPLYHIQTQIDDPHRFETLRIHNLSAFILGLEVTRVWHTARAIKNKGVLQGSSHTSF